ncbi:2-aminoethylphosphonate ABC transporter permease subunit [Streptomyces pathocidini]|uniref:2-aminoethylphosphonate ABC transporter permease subunit n=1 Tax=Streptomyces pathocidini TaxID=1650571 RepID=A0ABW7UYW4_9ACTN|nr:2-aminoethylphosphonate ABC transporter permease subunit [Streptomyces pathocidini]
MTAAATAAPRAARFRLLRPGSGGAWWVLPPLLVVGGAFLYPLALVVQQSFVSERGEAGLEVWRTVVTSAAFGEALLRTVSIAATATAGCLVVGTFLAVVLAFVPFPGARLVSRLVDTVLAFPSFLIALAFTFLYGSAGVVNSALTGLTGSSAPPLDFIYSPTGLVLAEITFYTPFVMRPLLAAFSQVPRAQLEVAASLGARPGRVLRQVLLPEALPALAAGGSLTLLLTLNEFGLVLFIGAKDVITLPMLVYTQGIVTFHYPQACVVAVVQVALSLALYGLYRLAHARMSGRTGGAR